MSDPEQLEQAMEKLDDLLPNELTESEVQTLIHMVCKLYSIEGRRLERFLLRMSKTCRRVENNLEAERQRLIRAQARED